MVEATRSPGYRIGDTWLGIPRPGVDPGPKTANSLSDDDDDDAETVAAHQGLTVALESAAEDLPCDVGFLHKIVELLEDKKQVILYGPPGTGKTYLAQRLDQALVGSTAVAETVDEDWMQRLDSYCSHRHRRSAPQMRSHSSSVNPTPSGPQGNR